MTYSTVAMIAFYLILLCVCFSTCHNSETSCSRQQIISTTDDPRILLQCRVRTINTADSVLANYTSAQMDRVTAFRLECSDVLFFESSLENTFLTQLRRLKELKLEYCKIRYVPPAVLKTSRELEHLTIRTHNTEWSAMTMEFHADSFRGLPRLKFLELSDNNIWSLPGELFCPLNSLTHLNLSANRLQNINEMSFSDWGNGPSAPGKQCNVGLEVLDLSSNEIVTLPDNGFTSLRSLQKLHVENNAVNTMAERAFVGLVSLQFLNASNNRLITLPPELFQSTRNLKELYLFNNSINVLAPGLLEGLDQLLILDLSRNELTSSWVNKDTFSGLVRLIALNLGHNRLSKIDSHTFQDLSSLQILNLEHNRIEIVSEGCFSALTNLHALTLSYNNLISVEPHYFSGAYVVNQLLLDHNRLSSIHRRAFENCSNLHDLSLHGNQLSEIPEAATQLHFLKNFDIGGNRIEHVTNASFVGLDQLYSLILTDNRISEIPKNAFSTLPSLQVLNLGFNRISRIDKAAFGSSAILRAIRLDGNKLQDIAGIFVSLPGLVWLNISDNDIQFFDYSFIPPSLEWLDMKKNSVADLGNYFEKRETPQIKVLDASFNRLTEISDTSIPDSVESVFLNNNLIKKVKINAFLRKANLTRVVLFANQLKNLDMAAVRLDPVPPERELPQFYIGENPFVCDCTMEWLQKVNTMSHRQYPRIMDVDAVLCDVIYGRGQTTKSLVELKSSQFLCPYESHCFAVCECCEYEACDCEMSCPSNCSCYHDHLWTSHVVDCSNAGYTAVPPRIPMEATEVYLDGNHLSELSSHTFLGKKRLRVLYLNDSKINILQNRTFKGVPELKVLHLENNNIENLIGFEFNELNKLSELYLSDNRITDLNKETLAPLRKLEILRLDDNRLHDLSSLSGISSSALVSISLNRNDWSCDCPSLKEISSWLNDNGNAVQSEDVRCRDGETLENAISKCTRDKTANGNSVMVEPDAFYSMSVLNADYVPFMAASLVIFIIIFLVATIAFIFRKDIELWAHSRYGVRILAGSSERDTERLYDAYLLYSLKDEEFVSQVIAANLDGLGYTTCLHYKDIHVVSSAFLTESLLGASEASRRLILVLSLSFLQTEWERPVFRAALKTCLESTRSRKGKIILISTTNAILSPELLACLKSCEVLSWGEKRFWEKLRFVMPDLNKHSNHHGLDSKKLSAESRAICASARYTVAPSALEAWYKMSPAVSSSVPTQSSCVSDESSQRTATDEEEPDVDDPSQHSYMSVDYGQQRLPTRQATSHHVYSSIPDPAPMFGRDRSQRTYFV